MSTETMDSNPRKINIQSKDHEQLLTVIDDLRSNGISRFIDLPQIIVVGDQSSGKSSVLEAVSGLTFPTKDALCTRFATELILRRSPTTKSAVSIVPDATRSDEEKQWLNDNFQNDGDVYNDLATIVESASEAMGLDGTTKKFSTDILRIELSGPDQPHLTLVDLPGLFHSGSKTQSDADAAAVKALVTSYMTKSRSIILAVVSAKNDVNNQIVISLAREHDRDGDRTLGTITKPDTLPEGSDSEKQYFELAENKDVFFRLGWHVLKNRDYLERHFTNAERDEAEKEFFNKGESIWRSLSQTQLGVDALRPRLAQVLQRQILKELPNLLDDVQKGVKECEVRLSRLGTSRGTVQEQRLHLHTISEAFTTIIKNAVRGRYDDEYFGNAATDEGYLKRVRAVVTNMLNSFSQEMATKGGKYRIVKKAPKRQSTQPPFKVTQEERLDHVKTLIQRNRGMELATVLKQETVAELTRDQMSPWEDIVQQHADRIFQSVELAISLALKATSDLSTLDGIWSCIISPGLSAIKTNFNQAIQQSLHQHKSGEPITYNHYLTENLQNARTASDESRLAAVLNAEFGVNPLSNEYQTAPIRVNTRSLLKALMKANEPDMTVFTCTEALATMEAYYKVALKKVIDDFAISAVEQSLMDPLKDIFPPTTAFTLDEKTVQEIAGESEETRNERTLYTRKLAILTKALEVLKRLDRGNSPSRVGFGTSTPKGDNDLAMYDASKMSESDDEPISDAEEVDTESVPNSPTVPFADEVSEPEFASSKPDAGGPSEGTPLSVSGDEWAVPITKPSKKKQKQKLPRDWSWM